jgi:AcrR family transcriptional regulator
LIDGTLRCIERLPPERITARAIADESGANLASITYHFGSKDNLVTAAAIAGLDRWLSDLERDLEELSTASPAANFQRAWEIVESSWQRHTGLVTNFVGALAKASHDPDIRGLLATAFRRSRRNVAAVIGLGDDAAGLDAAGLALALFHGLMLQVMLDPTLAIDGDRMRHAQARLRTVLATEAAATSGADVTALDT